MLRLVEAAMSCCEYTTTVDQVFRNEARRTHAQLKGITSVLRGLVTACDYPKGQVSLILRLDPIIGPILWIFPSLWAHIICCLVTSEIVG